MNYVIQVNDTDFPQELIEKSWTDEFSNIENSPILNGVKEGLNIIVTPHIGGMTMEAQQIAYNGVIDRFRKKING